MITNEMSPGCCSESLRIAPPGYLVLVPGKSGAATDEPSRREVFEERRVGGGVDLVAVGEHDEREAGRAHGQESGSRKSGAMLVG